MHQTKKIFCSLLFLLSGLLLTAQTIENPTFKARNGSIRNITRIERTPECTKVYIHAIFRPHWWIMEDGDSYLEDALEEREVAEAELNYYQSVSSGFKNNPDQLEDFDGTINSMVMDTVTVAEGFNGSGSGYRGQGFPVCAYGEQEPRVQLTLMGRRGRGTPYLLIDCILLVPRPDLIEEEDN